jgi:hypothetical protein
MLNENEERLWNRLSYPGSVGRPLALAPTVTPLPAWAFIASIAVIPVGLVMMFFVRRQAVIRFHGEIVVCETGFWKQRYGKELMRFTPGEREMELTGSALRIGDRSFHLEPGWREAGARLAAA